MVVVQSQNNIKYVFLSKYIRTALCDVIMAKYQAAQGLLSYACVLILHFLANTLITHSFQHKEHQKFHP